MTLYLIKARCPFTGDVVDLLEETEESVPLDYCVPIETEWCPCCGEPVSVGGWDVVEEFEVETVLPAEERSDDTLEDLVGEARSTVATLRGEADELADVVAGLRTGELHQYAEPVVDTRDQLNHRADALEAALEDLADGGPDE